MTSTAEITAEQVAAAIDHTLLKPEATPPDIDRLCREALHYQFAAVCVHPCHVPQAAEILAGHQTRVATVVGFPFGTNCTDVKNFEARRAIDDGVQEIDMVANLSAALTDDQTYLVRDITAVLTPCRAANPHVTLKLILETAALPDDDVKIMLAALAADLGVDYLKTSTGLHPAGGATLHDVKLLVRHGGHCRVKAAGGIRTADDARSYIAAGAVRLGTSAGVAIMQQMAR